MNSIAGVSVSAWRRPLATSKVAITPSWPPIATPTCSVAVSMPRINMAASASVALHLAGDPVPTPGPGHTDGAQLDLAAAGVGKVVPGIGIGVRGVGRFVLCLVILD